MHLLKALALPLSLTLLLLVILNSCTLGAALVIKQECLSHLVKYLSVTYFTHELNISYSSLHNISHVINKFQVLYSANFWSWTPVEPPHLIIDYSKNTNTIQKNSKKSIVLYEQTFIVFRLYSQWNVFYYKLSINKMFIKLRAYCFCRISELLLEVIFRQTVQDFTFALKSNCQMSLKFQEPE